MKFCKMVGIPDTVTYASFGDNRLRSLGVAGESIFVIPISLSSLQHSHYRTSVWYTLLSYQTIVNRELQEFREKSAVADII